MGYVVCDINNTQKSVQTILIGFLNCKENQFKLQCQVEVCLIFYFQQN